VETSNTLIRYLYDGAQRLDSVVYGDSADADIIQPFVVSRFERYKNGGVESFTDTEGRDYTYINDGLNRVSRIVNESGPDTLNYFFYDKAGRPDSLHRSNDSYSIYNFDKASQLLDLKHILSGTVIDSFHYHYDNAGVRDSLCDLAGSHKFVYDDIYQLIEAYHPMGNPQEGYDYDPLGNRDTSHISSSYTVDANNRLTEDDSCYYSYDNAGNMTWKKWKSFDDTIYFDYKADGQLIKIYDDTLEVNFVYNGIGNRVQKMTIVNDDTTIVKYTYFGANLLYEHDDSDTVTVSYLYGPGMDFILEASRNDSSYLHFTDALGSVTKITNSAGTVVRSVTYDTFGNIISESGVGAPGDQVTYTGREYDREYGYYYYRARYYDPLSGRFISSDPVGFAAEDVNLYRYVKNKPTVYTDPMGLITLEDIGTFAVGFGDGASFGLTRWIRNQSWYGDSYVNYCSGWYTGGQAGGYLASSYVTSAGIIRGIGSLGRAIGPLRNWIRIGRSFSRSGQFPTFGLRWGASTARNYRYVNQIRSPILRNLNQWLRGLRMPLNNWRTADPGHLHFWRL